MAATIDHRKTKPKSFGKLSRRSVSRRSGQYLANIVIYTRIFKFGIELLDDPGNALGFPTLTLSTPHCSRRNTVQCCAKDGPVTISWAC